MWIIRSIEQHKDLFVVISARLAPFAAVFVGLRAAKRQATAIIESTRIQAKSAALRDARQRNWEKLRDEFAAQICAIIEVNDALHVSPQDTQGMWQKIVSIEARTYRIRLGVSSASEAAYREWSEHEDGPKSV